VRIRVRVPQALVAVAVLAFAAVLAALTAQYQFDMPPCVWCVLQRLIYVVLGICALAGAFFAGGTRRVATGLAFLMSLAGIAASLWQQFYAAKQPSCDLTLADQIITALRLDRLVPQVFVAYASCADAAVNVIGVPFAFWSCAMFVLLAVLTAWALRASARRTSRAY
jgi:disulfide bond formation protein DsbB